MELQEYLDQTEAVEQEGFKVDDEQKANWALRKIAQFQNQQKQNNELATIEISKIEDWNKSENERLQQSIDFFQSHLASFAMEQREKDAKFKSMKLPNGRIGFRKKQAKWNYDDKTLVKTLKENNLSDFIRIKEEPDKSSIKEAFQVSDGKVINPDTGQILDGVYVSEQEESFEVKVND
ncbi:host-nuclease inhibitor Gam family protein [Paraliobacillus ryukyuensis]|uniref:host-nuclease inhibitor Gam family protein n=1 Tax=Paraliobacillus ryukyuensis TaxID=200904 RepID=UPI0009A8FBBE|nr:host-nuclease inhibitor Gam family protein [Paraliobacillus ryukyuensis]